MGDEPNEQDQHGTDVTDELNAEAPTVEDPSLDGGSDAGSGVFEDAAPVPGNFEHRRVVSIARQRLFGRGQPLRVGRYRVERRLGTGGMGEVYLAHDEDLDRRVAVKRVLATSTRDKDQERLRREARALARLSHPNVVGVYEVGEHEGRTFVAMEYVDGRTLGEWLGDGDEQKPWRSVLALFLAAGRGLAAAHDAGLVHRDFKPDNILLSQDGEVRVADFGLVISGERPAATEVDAPIELPAESRMSVTGAVRGTIRYMPLEQLRGEKVDARSDQFSFCVALYEALWGAPPFSLASTLARLADLQAGDPRPPRARKGQRQRPPAALWRVLRRGLAKQPEDRWPDMVSLLAALEDVTRRRRRLAWTATAAAALTLAVGSVALFAEPEVDPCGAVARELEGSWDPARRQELEALVGAGSLDLDDAGHVGESLDRVIAGLDRWSSGWTSEREQVCRARHEQRLEPELARLQGTCLTRQRQRVEDLVGLLLQPGTDADVLAGAVEAVAELPPASACEDELAMLGVVPASIDIAGEVEALRREIGRAHELRLLGRVDEGLTLAEESERAARELGYGPLEAEALAELAKGELAAGSLERGRTRLLDAIDACERHRHDQLAAELWTVLSLLQLAEFDDAEAGSWALRRAEAANGRIEASVRAQARLAFAQGQLAELKHDVVGAELGYRKALEVAERDEAAGPDLPAYLSNLARMVGKRDVERGVALFDDAIAAAEKEYGSNHRQLASILYNKATLLRQTDATDPQVAKLLERATNIWMLGSQRPNADMGKAELLLGQMALQQQDLEQAERHARRSKLLQEQVLPEEDDLRGVADHMLGTIASFRGDHERALASYQATLDAWGPAYGLDNPSVQRVHNDIAATLLASGQVEEAADTLDKLIFHLSGKGPEVIAARLSRCEVALRQGDLESASAELEEIASLPKGDHEFSYLLLRALVDLRMGTPDADVLAALRDARGHTRFTNAQVELWAKQLGLSASERSTLRVD